MMKNNDFCVIGLSKFGKTVAETLINLHKNVLVIDSDSKKVEAIASLVTWAIILDVTDKEALLKAEVDKFSNAIIAFDDDLITSIICAIILKAEFNIPNILARSINSHHSKILSMLGINIIVESEIESGKKAALKSIWGSDFNLIPINEDHSIVNFMIKTENVSLSSVDELNNEYGINIFAIKQHDKLIVPQRNYHLLINDEVFLFGQQKNIKNFYEKVKI